MWSQLYQGLTERFNYNSFRLIYIFRFSLFSQLQAEVIIYTAHWDHFGKRGEDIFHGARDNALSVAGVLKIAESLKNGPPVSVISIYLLLFVAKSCFSFLSLSLSLSFFFLFFFFYLLKR